MLNIGIFLKSANDARFEKALKFFADGIKTTGDNPILYDTENYENCDISVFFGSWKNRDKVHHNVRNEIILNSKNFICLETPLIGRCEVKDIMEDDSFRIGINGYLRDSGKFYKNNFSSERWELLKKKFNIDLLPWNNLDETAPILLALQIPGDASLRGCNISEWAYIKCLEIRTVSKRNIIIRTPQLDRKYEKKWIDKLKNIENVYFQKGTKENLIPTLKMSHCSVTYTSGLAVDSLINGCPTIACNSGNFCFDICSNNVTEVEELKEFDRSQWIHNLSYCQWDLEEIKNGKAWKHLRNLL